MEAGPDTLDYKALYEQEKALRASLERKVPRPDQNNAEKIDLLEQEILYLKLQIEKLKRLAFAQKRERFEGDPNQALLPFQMSEEEKKQLEEQTTEKISYERKKRVSSHSGRQPLPDHLPVEEVEIHPEGDLSGMVCIGKEVTEELECRPASYFIRRYIRYKYAPRDKGGVLIGTLPARVIEKGIAGPGLLASILVDKYADHLPLYRQIQRFKRENTP